MNRDDTVQSGIELGRNVLLQSKCKTASFLGEIFLQYNKRLQYK